MSTGNWDLFFWLTFWDDFSKSGKISTFFPEIGQDLLLHFLGLCTLINPFLAKKTGKK